MKTLLLIGASSLLLASPAMSTTYSINAFATGQAEATDITQGTALSLSGSGEGATFTGTATNVDHGSASAFASESISDVPDYNNSVGSHYYGLEGSVEAVVDYTIRVSGPVTGALVPVHITAIASAGSLAVPDDVYAPISGGTSATVSVQYAEGDEPVGAPANGILVGVYASTRYDYQTNNLIPPVLLGNTSTFDNEVEIAANFDVDVLVLASASARYEANTTSITETVEGGASADPSFVIDEPGYSAYTIEGVPAGPAATPAPEPATWAMMLIGFAGLGYARYRKAKTGPRTYCAA